MAEDAEQKQAGVEQEGTESGEPDEEEEEDDEYWPLEMVGCLQPPPTQDERKLLTRSNFPSKVGGKPAWLVPHKLPQTVCQACERPMRFLLQIYASRGEEKAGAFHRALHMFVCTNCQPNTIRVFRAQLPRENSYYSPDQPDEASVRALAVNDPALEERVCWECGLSLPEDAAGAAEEGSVANRCRECARLMRLGDEIAVFEERELTIGEAAWPEEEEEEFAEEDPSGGDAAGSKKLVEEADATISAATEGERDAALLQKLKEYKERVASNPENALDRSEQKVFEEYSKEQGEKDAVFSRFQRWSSENPGHVMRYVFGGEPLWFCTKGRMKATPPDCPRCGAERTFEFQVQPHLIASLESSALAKRLDYGAVCTYVCSASCDADADEPYIEEFVYVQPEPGDAWLPAAA